MGKKNKKSNTRRTLEKRRLQVKIGNNVTALTFIELAQRIGTGEVIVTTAGTRVTIEFLLCTMGVFKSSKGYIQRMKYALIMLKESNAYPSTITQVIDRVFKDD